MVRTHMEFRASLMSSFKPLGLIFTDACYCKKLHNSV